MTANMKLKSPLNTRSHLPGEASLYWEVCAQAGQSLAGGTDLWAMNGSICQGWESAVCFNRQLLFAPVRITEKFPALISRHRIFQSMMQQVKEEEYVKGRKRTDQPEKVFVRGYARSWSFGLEAFLCPSGGWAARGVSFKKIKIFKHLP